MLVEIGHFALVLALLAALVQGTVPLVGASVRSRPLMDLGRSAARDLAFPRELAAMTSVVGNLMSGASACW